MRRRDWRIGHVGGAGLSASGGELMWVGGCEGCYDGLRKRGFGGNEGRDKGKGCGRAEGGCARGNRPWIESAMLEVK